MSTDKKKAGREEESFKLDDGYQVVRREFFAHIHEPAVTFNRCRFYVNAAALAMLPETEHVQILVNPRTRKLALRPCSEDEKDSFAWCRWDQEGKRRPKHMLCRLFFAKLVELMEWVPEHRYKIIGKLVDVGGEKVFLFSLPDTEIFPREVPRDGKLRKRQVSYYPAGWRNQFGLPLSEHRKQLKVDIHRGYSIYSVSTSGGKR